MALQFIMGGSGSGKSHYLYQTVIAESMRDPDRNYIVLVPEQFTMQTQKDLVTLHPRKGIMNIDVLSFGRLAHRIFDEVGGNERTVLDDVGKNFILRKIAERKENKLGAFGNNLKKPGFISEVKSIISELTQYDIHVEQLADILEESDPNTNFHFKMKDIKTLYEEFERFLEGKYITGEEVLDVLCNVAKDADSLKDCVVVMDGFTGFTPVQNKLISELLCICHKVIITATIDPKEDPYVLLHKYQLFALSKQMVTSLVQIARDAHVEIEEPIVFSDVPVRRYVHNPFMAFLESHLFRHSNNQYKEEQDVITIHRCVNPKEEVVFAAGEIRRLIRENGYRYRDIAVIASDMNTYGDDIAKVFSKYEIPVFLDYKRSVLLNSFVEYVRSLLQMIEQNYTYEGVFRFLRTGLAGFTGEEMDDLENYVIALGIRGYKKWQQPWLRRTRGMKEPFLEKINSMRCRFVEKVDGLTSVLKKKRKSVYDITGALYEFLVQEELQQTMHEYELHFQDIGELSLAKEYAQVYRIVIELFDKFVELLGEESLSLKEYCALLDAGLEEAKIGVIPPSLDQVVAGDMKRTRLREIKALFILGINDTLLPGKLGKEGILSEQDREMLAKKKMSLAPGAKEEAYTQKFYLYQLMTKPNEKLYLSLSKISAGGSSLRPAYLIAEIKKMYPYIGIMEEDQKGIQDLELTPETGMVHLLNGIRDKKYKMDGSFEELYTWYFTRAQWNDRIQAILDAGVMKNRQEKLSTEEAQKLYGELLKASATRLETFATCPYQQFALYGLRLKERQEYELQALDMGNLFHKAMEHFSLKVGEQGDSWTLITDEKRQRLVAESVQESIVDYQNTVLYSSARNEYVITRLERLLNRTTWALIKQLEKGDFVPSGYEVNFGSGKIDRIDVCEEADKVYVKIIDYKTGAKTFDITSLYHGLQLQLAVYMEEAIKLEEKQHPGKEIIPAGIFYYQMKDPLVSKTDSEEKLEAAILKELRLDGLVNCSDAVIGHLDKNLMGNSLVVPVGRNKDTSLSKASKTASTQEFKVISDYVQKKVKEMERQIRDGDIKAYPYQLGNATGCDYCKFQGVCGFDSEIEGYSYRKLVKLKQEDMIEKMREET